MKKILCVILSLVLAAVCIPFASSAENAGTTYYIDSSEGNDANDGLSEETPFATAEKIRTLRLSAGDSVLFRAGGSYVCDQIELTAVGTAEAPVVISSYGEGAKPLLTTEGRNDILRLIDCSYVTVSGFEITAPDGGGIWIDTLSAESRGVTLSGLTMHDIRNTVATSRDSLSSPAAARACVMVKSLPARSRYAVNDFLITDCEMYDCGNGISIWGSWNDEQAPWCAEEDIDPVFNEGVLVTDCYFHDMDAEALIFGMCDGAVCENCRCIDCCQNDGVNDDGTTFCNAAMWFWGSVNSTIRYCEIAGQKCLGDGMTCDFDSYTHGCTYEYIYSHDNVRFVNNCPIHSGHHNNTIRYCLSVNDNVQRNNLSQFSDSHEYGLRFYGNTIINPSEYVIEGVRDGYIADNIFFGGITASFRTGRKNVDEATGGKFVNEFTGTMKNNCFWGTCIPFCAQDNIVCDPGFAGNDPSNPESFRLGKNSRLIGRGITPADGADDIFGNAAGSAANVGCYAGPGEENAAGFGFFDNILKFFSTVFGAVYQFIVECNNRYWLF